MYTNKSGLIVFVFVKRADILNVMVNLTEFISLQTFNIKKASW